MTEKSFQIWKAHNHQSNHCVIAIDQQPSPSIGIAFVLSSPKKQPIAPVTTFITPAQGIHIYQYQYWSDVKN